MPSARGVRKRRNIEFLAGDRPGQTGNSVQHGQRECAIIAALWPARALDASRSGLDPAESPVALADRQLRRRGHRGIERDLRDDRQRGGTGDEAAGADERRRQFTAGTHVSIDRALAGALSEDRGFRQSDRGRAEAAQEADAEGRRLSRDEEARPLRETVGQAQAQGGPGAEEAPQGHEAVPGRLGLGGARLSSRAALERGTAPGPRTATYCLRVSWMLPSFAASSYSFTDSSCLPAL